MLRRFPLVATIDTPPAAWHCASVSDSPGATILTGRFHTAFKVNTRFHLKGRIYHVDYVVNREERDVDMTLTCHEVFD